VKSVGDLLKEYLREKGWMSGNPYEPLFRDWKSLAGEALGAHSRLLDVKEGFLQVEVDHPGWLQMGQLRKAAILEGARLAAPGARIEGIRFRLGGG
jgi:predicted nucleic acid-binding Zn ribbon protein